MKLEITGDNIQISDGYHTIDELYEHRIVLFIALCKVLSKSCSTGKVWKSTTHSDGTAYGDWFIMGIGTENGEQITYHLPFSKWTETNFCDVLDKAPEWDGHTSKDVLDRIKLLTKALDAKEPL